MKSIEEYAKREEVYDDNSGKWTQDYTTQIWEAVGDKYINSKFRGNRTAETSWKTLYNKMEMVKAFNLDHILGSP